MQGKNLLRAAQSDPLWCGVEILFLPGVWYAVAAGGAGSGDMRGQAGQYEAFTQPVRLRVRVT